MRGAGVGASSHRAPAMAAAPSATRTAPRSNDRARAAARRAPRRAHPRPSVPEAVLSVAWASASSGEAHVARGLEPLGRLLLEAPPHDAVEDRRDSAASPSRSGGGSSRQDGGERVGRGRTGERALSREHLVENGPEGEDVAARVGRAAPCLLRRHVRDRAQQHAGGCRLLRDSPESRPRGRELGRSIRARPKSRTLARPSRVRKTLSGLRSRWTMPPSCAAESLRAIWIAISTALRGGRRPSRSLSRSDSPSRSSVTIHG